MGTRAHQFYDFSVEAKLQAIVPSMLILPHSYSWNAATEMG